MRNKLGAYSIASILLMSSSLMASEIHENSQHISSDGATQHASTNIDLNERDNRGNTKLALALKKFRFEDDYYCDISFDPYDEAKELLEIGSSVNTINHDGETPLHVAVHRRYLKGVRELMDSGADINAKDKNGNTPLNLLLSFYPKYTALHKLYENIARELIEAGADINAENNKGHRPLETALDNNYVNLLDPLLLSKANINVRRALNAVINRKDLKTLNKLIEAGFEVNAEGEHPSYIESALYIAVKKEDSQMLKALIEVTHADVNTKGWSGKTLLQKAVERGCLGIAKVLIRAGADVNAKGGYPYAVNRQDSEMLEALIDAGTDVDAADEEGNTVLHLAADRSSPEIVKLLIRAGANVNAPNNDGKTPLHLAIAADSEGIDREGVVKALIAAGAYVTATEPSSEVMPIYRFGLFHKNFF